MARDFCLSIETSFMTHVKTRKFCRIMGSHLAFGHLISLWSWAADVAPNGDLIAIDVPEIEEGAGHRGEPGACYAALVASGFIDATTGGPRIHNWMEPGRTGYALQQAEVARDRWRRAKGIPTRTDVSARNPRGIREESKVAERGMGEDSSVLHGSRFTVHGSDQNGSEPEDPPRQAVLSAAVEKTTPVPGLDFPVDGPPTSSRIWWVTEAIVASLTPAYPSLDIVGECRKAKVWVEANPTRRKTGSGMRKFIVNWLNNAQNRGNGRATGPPTGRATGQEIFEANRAWANGGKT